MGAMRKWVGPILSVWLVVILIYFFGLPRSQTSVSEYEGIRTVPAIFGRMEEKEEKEEGDSHYIQVLKMLRQEIDGWLKSLNEKIEQEDIARYEVRFYEILRSILEWVREKIDAKIAASEKKKPERTETEGLMREARLKGSPGFAWG